MKTLREGLEKIGEMLRDVAKLATVPEGGGERIDLAAGVPKPVQCGRTGTFVGMGGKKVTFAPEDLTLLSARFNQDREHKAKIGHKRIDTDTPDYGDVSALAYDAKADRLLATVVPTEALVEKNRKEGFRRVSMELSAHSEGGYEFEDLAFLGAHRPAISGLDPVALAAEESEEDRAAFVFSADATPEPDAEIFAFSVSAKQRAAIPAEDFAGPDRTFPIDTQAHLDAAATLVGKAANPSAVRQKAIAIAKRKGLKLPASWEEDAKDGGKDDSKEKMASGNGGLDTGATLRAHKGEKTMDEKQAAKLARLEKQAKDGAADRVATFLAANTKRIPMLVRKAGLEPFLVGLLAAEAVAEDAGTIKFAAADEKEVEETAGQGILRMLAALPEQTTSAAETELATADKAKVEGDAGEVPENVREFESKASGVKFAKSEFNDRVVARLSEMRKTDPKATFSQAYDIVAGEKK